MRAVILVPRREDRGPRDATWAWVKAWWEENLPELEIYEGHHTEGLFNRSAAVNLAAKEADKPVVTTTGLKVPGYRLWDVALLIDSDVICDPEQVREAIDYASEHDGLVLAFSRRHNLNRHGSEAIMAGEKGSWRRFIVRTYTEMASSAVAFNRKTWDLVGGFDERFQGWGFEDSAFSLAVETFTGNTTHKIEGELWHLWHPTAPEGKRGTPSYIANKSLKEQYQQALGDIALTKRLRAGESISAPLRAYSNIPRILHRTVPEQTNGEVEANWKRFKALHPGWEFLTHRDPLDPKDWPLTGAHWSKCSSGAQKAGLIRLEALYRWGGVYVDSDCEPYRSLEPLLDLKLFAAWEDRNVIPDAVLGAEPEHPAIKECIRLAIKMLPQGAWHSGPGVTTRVLQKRNDVTLLPPGTFYPYHYHEKQRRNEDHKSQQPWAFMAHHWAGSWLDQR